MLFLNSTCCDYPLVMVGQVYELLVLEVQLWLVPLGSAGASACRLAERRATYYFVSMTTVSYDYDKYDYDDNLNDHEFSSRLL